jgi:hypothetical protein
MKALKQFYFSELENRVPEPPLPINRRIELFWQIAAMAAIGRAAASGGCPTLDACRPAT